MAGKIFINYRRGDDPQAAGRLFDRLHDVFEPHQLFLDVDNIAPGLDFVRVLDERVAECDVVLAVIGKNWIDARDETGARRLDDPDDFVRIEITAALSQDKRVIPVLVGDAQMPRAMDLPEALRPLARRNAVRLTHERFRADTQGLVKALQQALEEIEAHRRTQADADSRTQAETEPRQHGAEVIRRAQEAEPARQKDEKPRLPLIEPMPRQHRPKPVVVIAAALGVMLVAALVAWVEGGPGPNIKPTSLLSIPPPQTTLAAAPTAQAPAEILPPAPPSSAHDDSPAAITKSVKREVSLGYLNLRSGPGQDQKVLARIPAGATGVVLAGSCVPPRDSASGYPFCLVEWNGLRGWVSSNGLE
jgi:hypothetical protein